MRKNFIAFFIAVGSFFTAEAQAGSLADKLRAAEHEGLRSVSADRMKQLVGVAVPRANPTGTIQFTKSWIDSRPRATGGRHWRCLSEALYFEARGETVKGMFAVAEVILNRVRSTRFPDNICGVVNQGTGRKYQCQFTYTCDGMAETIREPAAYARVGKIARLVMDGKAPKVTGGATHYHTTAVRPKWSRVYAKTARIGVHVFYRHTYRSAKGQF